MSLNPSKRRGSAKKGVDSDDTRKRRELKQREGRKFHKDEFVRNRRSNAGTWSSLPMSIQQQNQQDMDHIAKREAVRRANWEEYKKQLLNDENIDIDTCKPAEIDVLINILDELKLEENKMQLGGGKMVGGNKNPIEQLIALNNWIAKKEGWSTCANWFLTQIWEKFWELYDYTSYGIGYAIGIIKDVGLTALGDTKTETFKFTVGVFYDLIDAGSGAIDAAADKAYPYFKEIEKDVTKILVENKNKVSAKMPGVVTPLQFQEWLDNTSMVNKIYWTLVTLKSYQAGPLIGATITTTGSIIMSASYYGVLMAYYITSNNYFTLALLTSAAATTGYDKLSPENQQKILAMGNKLDEFISDMILGPEVSPLTSMMNEIKDLPDKAKLVALKQANLQKKLTKTILTNAETNAELSEILKSKEIEAKIAEVEAETAHIQEQIALLEEKKEREDIERDLGGMDTTPDGGKRRTRKRGKRHSKRAPRKTKTLRKKRRGKK